MTESRIDGTVLVGEEDVGSGYGGKGQVVACSLDICYAGGEFVTCSLDIYYAGGAVWDCI